MKINVAPSFFDSLKKISNSHEPWKFEFWKSFYYNTIRKIRNLIKYFKPVTNLVPWDYTSILSMMKCQLSQLADCISNGELQSIDWEEDAKNIQRVIELIENHEEDNYSERCGYDSKYGIDFVKDGKFYRLEDNASDEQRLKNSNAIKNGAMLHEKEWDEMFDLLKKMRKWWV